MSARRSRRDYRHDDSPAGNPADSSNRRSQYDDHSKLTEMVDNYRRSRGDYRDDDLSAGYRPDIANRGSYNEDNSRSHETSLSNTDWTRSHQNNNTRSQESQKSSHRHDAEHHRSRSHENSFYNLDRQRSHQNTKMSNFDASRSQGSSIKTSNRHDDKQQQQGLQRKSSFEKFTEERDKKIASFPTPSTVSLSKSTSPNPTPVSTSSTRPLPVSTSTTPSNPDGSDKPTPSTYIKCDEIARQRKLRAKPKIKAKKRSKRKQIVHDIDPSPSHLTPQEESLMLRPRSYTTIKWETSLVQCFGNKCPINVPDYMLKVPDSADVLGGKLMAANRVFQRIDQMLVNNIEFDASAIERAKFKKR